MLVVKYGPTINQNGPTINLKKFKNKKMKVKMMNLKSFILILIMKKMLINPLL